jgi:uncharacterized BrkB/YihY/UPF0761 family membrane protein
MEIVALVGSTLMGGAMNAVMSTVATFVFILLVSLIPTYIALYRKCFRRAVGLAWVVLIADIGLLGMPPFGIALWLAALAYAFVPRRRRQPARIRRPIPA